MAFLNGEHEVGIESWDGIGESAWLSSNDIDGITEQRHGITLWLAKLVNITLITMVYGRYNYSIHGVYRPTNITGGHHPVHHNHKKKLSQLFFSGVPRQIFGFQNRSIKLSTQLWKKHPHHKSIGPAISQQKPIELGRPFCNPCNSPGLLKSESKPAILVTTSYIPR